MPTRTKKKIKKDLRDVKTRILDVATKLFADRGFLGVSLREIMSTADVNVASAHYYFGSKEKLYEACALRFFGTVNEGRRNGLERVMNEPDLSKENRLRQLLMAYTTPHYHLLGTEEGSHYVSMIARSLSEPTDVTRALLQRHFGDTRKAFIDALCVIFPELDRDILYRTFSFFVDYMLNAPSDFGYEALSGESAFPVNLENFTSLVVSFAIGGFLYVSEF